KKQGYQITSKAGTTRVVCCIKKESNNMKLITYFLILFCAVTNAQNDKIYPLKFEGHLKGVFEIIEIDTSNSVNFIKFKLKYLINSNDYKNTKIPDEFIALVYTEKVSKKNTKLKKLSNKLSIGKEYFLDLKHPFYFNTLNPPP